MSKRGIGTKMRRQVDRRDDKKKSRRALRSREKAFVRNGEYDFRLHVRDFGVYHTGCRKMDAQLARKRQHMSTNDGGNGCTISCGDEDEEGDEGQ